MRTLIEDKMKLIDVIVQTSEARMLQLSENLNFSNNNRKVANADAVYLNVESNSATDVTSCFCVLQTLKLD